MREHPYRPRPTTPITPSSETRAVPAFAGVALAVALAASPDLVPRPAQGAATRTALRYPVRRAPDDDITPLRDVTHLASSEQWGIVAVRRDGSLWDLFSSDGDRDVATPRPADPLVCSYQDTSHGCRYSLDGACRVRPDGTVGCTPPRANGRIRHTTRPHPIATDARFTALSTGPGWSCGVTTDARVRCWGPSVTEVRSLDDARDVALRRDLGCALRRGGDVWCWARESPRPARVEGLPPAEEIVASATATCARDAAGTVRCWGVIGHAWPGHPRAFRARRPLDVALPGPARSIRSDGVLLLCATLRDGRELCWGGRADMWDELRPWNELGDDRSPVLWPRRESDLVDEAQLLPDGRVLRRDARSGFGWSVLGDLPPARALRGAWRVEDTGWLNLPERHTCALARDGRAWCWGNNWGGQLGLDDEPDPHREGTVMVLRAQ